MRRRKYSKGRLDWKCPAMKILLSEVALEVGVLTDLRGMVVLPSHAILSLQEGRPCGLLFSVSCMKQQRLRSWTRGKISGAGLRTRAQIIYADDTHCLYIFECEIKTPCDSEGDQQV